MATLEGVGCMCHVSIRKSLLDALEKIYVVREGGGQVLGERVQRVRVC